MRPGQMNTMSNPLTPPQQDMRAILTGIAVTTAVVGNSQWMVHKFTAVDWGVDRLVTTPTAWLLNPLLCVPLMIKVAIELKCGRFVGFNQWLGALAETQLGAAMVSVVLPAVGGLFWGMLVYGAISMRYGLQNIFDRHRGPR